MNFFSNIAKGIVAVAALPVVAVVDVLTLPASSMDTDRGPFDRTDGMLKRVGECFDEATKPDKD